MDAAHYADRYASLKLDIERCLSHRDGWAALPPLLDQLDAVRSLYQAARSTSVHAPSDDARNAGASGGQPRLLQ